MQRFAIIGLGRFGEKLALALTRAGAEVIAVDKDRKLIEQISEEVTMAVRLDSTDPDALRAQGIDKVDAAIVGIGQDFEANILTTMILKSLGVKYICSRAEQPTQEMILRRIGADEVIFPEEESANRWAFRLRAPQIHEKLEFAEGYSLAQYTAPESFDGKTLLELDLRKKYHVNLIGLRKGGEQGNGQKKIHRQIINVPQPDMVINQGDLLWLVGRDEDLAALPQQ